MRFRRRLIVLALVVPSGIWLGWFLIARHEMNAKIEEYAARGEPVNLSELDYSAIPNQQNAAFYYQAAFANISRQAISPSASSLSFQGHPPYSGTWQAMADAAVAADGKALALARQARQYDQADWGVRITPGTKWGWGIPLLYLNPARNLANLLGDSAIQAHIKGNDKEALQRIFDLFHLADTVQQRGFVVGRLVGIGIEALAAQRLQILAACMDMNGNRQEVLQLIGQLLDEHKVIDGRLAMARYECCVCINDKTQLASEATVLRPMIYLSVARDITNDERFELALQQTNWPGVLAVFQQPPSPHPAPAPPPNNAVIVPRFSRFPDSYLGLHPDSQYRFLVTEYRVLSQRRTTAVSLALNLYHADHHVWPANLQQLVPNYLPNIPDDPFYTTGHPIGYTIADPHRPLLYIDDISGPKGGTNITNIPTFGWNNNTGTRQWLDVTNWWQSSPATQKSGS